MQLNEGTLLQGGKYRIERMLGQGGFGITYLAEQSGLNRKVAVKEFFMKDICVRDAATSHVSTPSEGGKDLVGKFRVKFVKEAQTIAAFEHPHIVRVHDIFEENGTAYYVMEYHNCGSLADQVKQRGSLPEAEAVRYIREVADALDHLHKNQINHLDVKPDNILLNKMGGTVLIDFGISKHYDEEGKATTTTPVGISHGYAPLEQYRKGGVGTFSPATDIYSLGATLYKLITGTTPPEANDVLNYGLPKLPAGISPLVRNVIEQAMQPRQCDRPQTISEFLALIEKSQPIAVVADSSTQLDSKIETEVIGNSNKTVKVTPPIKNSEPAAKKEKRRYIPAAKKEKKKSSGCLWMVLLSLIVVAIAALFYSQSHEHINLSVSGSINGHEYVDLGLPSGLKWATCNVGASSPEDYGDYFAWGDTTTKSSYTTDSCKTYEKNIGDISGNPEYDVARSNWGGSWRLPTDAEMQELIDNCKWEWTTYNGKKGYLVTSEKNGNSIFLPAAGWRFGTSLYRAGEFGGYWTSTPNEGSTQGAYSLRFYGGSHYVNWLSRLDGLSVRPVSE